MRRRVDLTWLLAGAAAILAAIGYAAASIERHERFGSNAFDLGIYDQTIWGYSRFDVLADNTVLETPNLLGNHFQPILVARTPLYWVWDDVPVLLVAQAVFLAGASLPSSRGRVANWARPRRSRSKRRSLSSGQSSRARCTTSTTQRSRHRRSPSRSSASSPGDSVLSWWARRSRC